MLQLYGSGSVLNQVNQECSTNMRLSDNKSFGTELSQESELILFVFTNNYHQHSGQKTDRSRSIKVSLSFPSISLKLFVGQSSSPACSGESQSSSAG
ncbi:hypothetical protein NQZ68_039151 [Dissostichus eleginoides]|nr:hypothetical protein NQZ68_039151 [Dissostichus eleginoides]